MQWVAKKVQVQYDAHLMHYLSTVRVVYLVPLGGSLAQKENR